MFKSLKPQTLTQLLYNILITIIFKQLVNYKCVQKKLQFCKNEKKLPLSLSHTPFHLATTNSLIITIVDILPYIMVKERM